MLSSLARAMTQSAAMFVWLLLLGSLHLASAQDEPSQDNPMLTVQAFVRSNEAGDVERTLNTFDDAATVFFPGERPQLASGKATIREVFVKIFEQRKGPVTITLRDVNVQRFGNTAIVTAHLRDLPAATVQEATTFPRRTFVLQRVADRWLIVHLHASSLAVAPAQK
jgi:uncharacterized protein (TIGR02246 family)